MQDYTKFEALVKSLRESLKHCQYENFGRPYDKDAQFAFGSNWYSKMTDFWNEFKSSLPLLRENEQKLYCNEVYYKIAWYVILFDHLKDDYERKLSGSGRAKLSEETYNLVLAYSTAICDYSRLIREAAKLRGIALLLPNELTIESYRPGGSFIQPNILDVEVVEEEHKGQVVTDPTSLTSASTIEKALSGVEEETTEQLPYRSFVDLFMNPDDIKPCVDVLNNYENGRNREGKFKKFVFVAWIDCLSRVNKIHTNKYELVAPILENEFDGYSISRSTWYEPGTGYKQAKEHFTINIPR